MSIRVVGFVLDLNLPPMEKLLLIVLGECADDWGDSIFPALETLERKTGMSRRTVQRTLVSALEMGVLVQSAQATPVSPAFYRIVGVPEPSLGERPKERPCPVALRRAVLYTFGYRCEYCGRRGLTELASDGHPWQVHRLDQAGAHVPENVTLACRTCTSLAKRGRRMPEPVRSLTVRQRETAADPAGGVNLTPPSAQFDLLGGVNVTPGGGVSLTPGGCQRDTRGGVSLTPDPLIDPLLIRQKKEQGAGAPDSHTEPKADTPNFWLIVKLAHETIEHEGERANEADLLDALKQRLHDERIPHSTPVDLVGKALDAARWQRKHRMSAS